MVGGIWTLAVAGISERVFSEPSLAVRTGFLFLMGWVGCGMYFELVKRCSMRKSRTMLVGGLFFSVGAAINLTTFSPYFTARLFTPHAVFHLFVIAGSTAHYYFMLTVLVPYRRLPAFTFVEPAKHASAALAKVTPEFRFQNECGNALICLCSVKAYFLGWHSGCHATPSRRMRE